MMAIITLTMNPAVDKSSTVPSVVPERKLRCIEPSFEPGGGGINVSRALKILGGQSHAVFPAGGHTGELLKQLLSREGLASSSVNTEGWIRENLIIYEETTGLQYRFGMPGPHLSEPEWRECMDLVFSAGSAPVYIVASGSLPPGVPEDFYAVLSRKARERGIRVILDTTGLPLRLALEEGVFMIKPNIGELRDMAGDELSDDASQDRAALEIIRNAGAEVVVVSLGAAGAIIATKDGTRRLRAPAVPIKSKVGAGDSMVAGTVLGLIKGESIQNAAIRGIATGSAAVMTPGTELCRKEDAERLYAQMMSAGQEVR